MTDKEVLDKVINKRPFLCRLGFHLYKRVWIYFSAKRRFTQWACRRVGCGAVQTRAEPYDP